jgi:hypothetical protein
VLSQAACGSYSGSEREHAAVIMICLRVPRLRTGKVTSSGSRNLPVAQPGTVTDVMRDVLRLVDVDLLQVRNCNRFNGDRRSTIARRQTIFSSVSFDMVVCLSDMTSCPVEWQPRASEAAFGACRPKKARATYGSRP